MRLKVFTANIEEDKLMITYIPISSYYLHNNLHLMGFDQRW